MTSRAGALGSPGYINSLPQMVVIAFAPVNIQIIPFFRQVISKGQFDLNPVDIPLKGIAHFIVSFSLKKKYIDGFFMACILSFFTPRPASVYDSRGL